MKRPFITALIALSLPCQISAQTITTVAGGGSVTGNGSPATDAALGQPIGIAIDKAGNVYAGDRENNLIRKITPDGIITSIAGTGAQGYSGDGKAATAAEINQPYGVAVDGAGNVYFTDAFNNCVRKIDNSGIITTIAGNDTAGFRGDGGPATKAELNLPIGLAVDAEGDVLFADQVNNRIRLITPSDTIYTIAGTGIEGHTGDGGPAIDAQLDHPYALMLDVYDNLYVGEQRGGRVRKVTLYDRMITTIAGSDSAGFSGDNGPATYAMLEEAEGLALDSHGNLYISDTYNNRIRVVNSKGIITTYAGTDSAGFSGDGGAATAAQLFFPDGLAIDTGGSLYVVDQGNNRIRRITPAPKTDAVAIIPGATGSLTLYPNPSNGAFTFYLSASADEQLSVTITNMTGELIGEYTGSTNRVLNIRLDAPPGIYLLPASGAGQKWNARMALQ